MRGQFVFLAIDAVLLPIYIAIKSDPNPKMKGEVKMKNVKPTLSAVLSTVAFVAISNAFAIGTPDQDPIIADLRNRFMTGTVPSQGFLSGTKWRCLEFEAARDRYESMAWRSNFSAFDGYLKRQLTTETAGSITLHSTFINNGKEWIATKKDAGGRSVFSSIRMDSKGSLIEEYGFSPEPGLGMELSPLSAAPEKYRIASYAVCRRAD